MKTISDINLHQWFGDRELPFVPKHFVKSKTPLTEESRMWVLEKCIGRFALTTASGLFGNRAIAFEDPKEAMFFELTWS